MKKIVLTLLTAVAIFCWSDFYSEAATSQAPQRTAASSAASAGLELKAKSLGKITIGMAKASLPATVAGLYSSKSFTRIDHNEYMDCPYDINGYFTCKLNGKATCYIYIDRANKVCGIYVTTSSIKSADGVKTGASVATVKRMPGMRFELMEMGNSYYVGKTGINYVITDDEPDVISAMAIGLYY